MLKVRAEYNEKSIDFDVGIPISLYVAVDATVTPPLENKFKELEQEMALVKINSLDKNKLEKLQPVRGTEDISLKIYKADFQPGKVHALTNCTGPTKMVIWIAPMSPNPTMSCGGAEIEITRDST